MVAEHDTCVRFQTKDMRCYKRCSILIEVILLIL